MKTIGENDVFNAVLFLGCFSLKCKPTVSFLVTGSVESSIGHSGTSPMDL